MIRLFVLALLATTVFSSCSFMGKKVRGSGNVTTQVRTVTNFKSIDASGAVNVYVTQDSGYAVKVVIDENLQEYIEVYEEGGVLNIHPRHNTNIDATGRMKVYVSAPMFEKFSVSGASKIIGESKISSAGIIAVDATGASDVTLDIKVPDTDIQVSGASNVYLTGLTKNLVVDGSGESNVKCFELLSENADVDVSGASNADVFASVALKASASGASDIKYKGAATYSGDASGAGSIKKVD